MSHIVDPSEAIGIWDGPPESIVYDQEGIAARLRDLSRPCYVIKNGRGLGVTTEGQLHPDEKGEAAGTAILAIASPLPAQRLGDPAFRATYGLDYAYMTGAMANAIASEEMVIALGKARLLGSFGAGGLPPQRLEAAIHTIQAALPDSPYAFNLIHSPNEPALERGAVELYLKHGVRTIEASAYLRLTPHVVRYRAAGLALDADGEIEIAADHHDGDAQCHHADNGRLPEDRHEIVGGHEPVRHEGEGDHEYDEGNEDSLPRDGRPSRLEAVQQHLFPPGIIGRFFTLVTHRGDDNTPRCEILHSCIAKTGNMQLLAVAA
jgi:hypothetical protein